MTALALSVAALAAAGCSEGYRVLVRFDPPELVDELEWIEVALVDDCGAQPGGGAALVGARRRFEVRRGESPPALGEVEPGDYGVAVRGRSETCRVAAAGCSGVTLAPGERGLLVVTARPVEGPGCDPTERCQDGACVADGGDADADADEDAGADADGDSPPDPDADADQVCPCRIDGECYEEGETSPWSPCEACDPERDPTAWSRVAEGSACVEDDGQAGTCRTGLLGGMSCCAGCWLLEGMVCMPGTMDVACGDRGAACEICVSPEVCLPLLGRCGRT